MPDRLSILCIHGVGHGDVDPLLIPSWTDTIKKDLHRWNSDLEIGVDFLSYDHLFDHAPLNAATWGEAVAKLLASGVVHGIGDLFAGVRGLLDIPDQIKWTAGMIAQWASEDDLRDALRALVREKLTAQPYDMVCAHSLGSLICYDAFRRNPGLATGKIFVTLGSQIGNPFVRDCFAGRIEPLDARSWYHLYNPEDHVFTSEIRLQSSSFVEIRTDFDKPSDILNHDPIWYFNHTNTLTRVWFDVSGTRPSRAMVRDFKTTPKLTRRPQRRALLIGINAYPNPANRLEGCVNDVYLVSSVLQECGFPPDAIRVVLDERATAANILERLHWLLDDVHGEDERVLFYSGHGAQIPTYDVHGEVDHLDECLVPYDFDWSPAHAIRDKQFVEFYSQLPYDSRFVAVFDCCHSGGMSRDGGPRVRGIDPPDDIRHRDLRWNAKLGMWEDRKLETPTRSIQGSKSRRESYLGKRGVTYRFGRGIGLRGLPSKSYKPERKGLRHKGPYLPIILEACREEELSYEYRHGASSYGAFTFSLAKVLREGREMGKNPSFHTLVQHTAKRLHELRYEQTPCLVGPKRELSRTIPWTERRKTNARPAQ